MLLEQPGDSSPRNVSPLSPSSKCVLGGGCSAPAAPSLPGGAGGYRIVLGPIATTLGGAGGATWGQQGLAPTLAFSMRMLVLCPLVPSVLWPLPALRMLPMLPSLPTLFLSPAAQDRRGAHQQCPGTGADTGHQSPRQGPVCQQ